MTTGYRWVLTYNLALDQSQPRPSAGLQRSETRPLHDCLKRWLDSGVESRLQPFLHHVLDHDYTEANMSLKGLKTQDLARVQALKHISEELPFEVFLSLLEKREFGPCEFDYDDYNEEEEEEESFHYLEEVFETDYTIKTLVDLDGQPLATNLHFDGEHLLEDCCFDDLEGEEDYEGYMGNSGPSATHWYRISAIAIVPHDSLSAFFTCGKGGHCGMSHKAGSAHIGTLARGCLRPSAKQSSIEALEKLCYDTWSSEFGSIDGKSLQEVLKVAMEHRRSSFFHKAAGQQPGNLRTEFFTWARNWLRTGNDASAKGSFGSVKRGLR